MSSEADVYVFIDGMHHLNFEAVFESKPDNYDKIMDREPSYGEGFAFYETSKKKHLWGHYCGSCGRIGKCDEHNFVDSSVLEGPYGYTVYNEILIKAKTDPLHYHVHQIETAKPTVVDGSFQHDILKQLVTA